MDKLRGGTFADLIKRNYNNHMRITFDLTKDTSNMVKHGVSLAEAELLDWDSVLAMPDVRRNYGELREIGCGLIGDRLYCMVFVQRNQVLHIISLRQANSREVSNYVQST